MARTLYDKIWDEHVVHTEEDGTAVLYIDRHLVHEVTSPQAFEGLRLAGRKVWRVSSIVATADARPRLQQRNTALERRVVHSRFQLWQKYGASLQRYFQRHSQRRTVGNHPCQCASPD